MICVPVPVATRSKAWVCGRSLPGIVGSNPAGVVEVWLVWMLLCCQVEVSASGWSLIQRHPTDCGASLYVISEPWQRGGLGQLGLYSHEGKKLCLKKYTWSDNKVRELIAVKVLHTSLLNTTVVAFKVLPFGSYAPMLAPSPPFKTILQLVLWNGLQCCRCITPDVINVIKMPSFQYFLYLREQKKVTGG